MKPTLGAVVVTSVVASSVSTANAGENGIKVSDLNSVGIDREKIILGFSREFNVTLSLADLLEVQSINEGTALRLETLDHLAVVVPVLDAHGPYNKDNQ